VFLEKLTGSQLVNKFSAFYGLRKFNTAFTSARHQSLSSAISIQSMPSHPTSWRSIFKQTYYLSLGLLSGLFPSGFPTKTMYTPLLSSIRAICPARLILDLITRIILGEEYRPQLLIMQFSSLLCYPAPLRHKHSPQHSILKHPQPTFLPQCARPCFTPIQNNTQNYSSVVNLNIFG
jgi:hypothetical protein